MGCNTVAYQKLLVKKFKANNISEIDRKLVDRLLFYFSIKLFFLDLFNYKYMKGRTGLPKFFYKKIADDEYMIKNFYQLLTMYVNAPAHVNSDSFKEDIKMIKYLKKKNRILINITNLEAMKILMARGFVNEDT